MQDYQEIQTRRNSSKVTFGIIVIIFGVLFLLKKLYLLPAIHIREVWPVILIIIGFVIGLRNRFKNPGSWILMGIGVFNLIPAFEFELAGRTIYSNDLAAPAILIGIGFLIILNNRKKKDCKIRYQINTLSNDTIGVDVVFGGRKEFVTSKDFQGGRVTATFGGAEINLLQTEISGDSVTLDIRATFGGVEIIVPPHWHVKNDVETVFGAVEDHRRLRSPDPGEIQKTLLLKGSCIFGGVEIKSF